MFTFVCLLFAIHEFYAGIQEENKNLYLSPKFALGATDLSINLPAPSSDDHLLLALSLKQLIYETINIVQPLLHSESQGAEMATMKGRANVVYLETIHYTKHLFRGWVVARAQRSKDKKSIERQARYYFGCSRQQVKDLPTEQTREYVRIL